MSPMYIFTVSSLSPWERGVRPRVNKFFTISEDVTSTCPVSWTTIPLVPKIPFHWISMKSRLVRILPGKLQNFTNGQRLNIWLRYCRYGVKPYTINQSIQVNYVHVCLKFAHAVVLEKISESYVFHYSAFNLKLHLAYILR